jgi:hypothetical protein
MQKAAKPASIHGRKAPTPRPAGRAHSTRLLSRISMVTMFSLMLPIAASAESPILTLAMVRPEDMVKRHVQIPRERPAAEVFQTAPAPAAAPVSFETLRLSLGETAILSLAAPLQRRSESGSVMLTRTNLREFGRPRMWASLEAGYGQVFEKGKTLYGHNGSLWEERGGGYLKLIFSF